jgi:hypothetical protein
MLLYLPTFFEFKTGHAGGSHLSFKVQLESTPGEVSPWSFGLISRISSHPAVFFSHNKPANSTFSTINQRNEQAD